MLTSGPIVKFRTKNVQSAKIELKSKVVKHKKHTKIKKNTKY